LKRKVILYRITFIESPSRNEVKPLQNKNLSSSRVIETEELNKLLIKQQSIKSLKKVSHRGQNRDLFSPESLKTSNLFSPKKDANNTTEVLGDTLERRIKKNKIITLNSFRKRIHQDSFSSNSIEKLQSNRDLVISPKKTLNLENSPRKIPKNIQLSPLNETKEESKKIENRDSKLESQRKKKLNQSFNKNSVLFVEEIKFPDMDKTPEMNGGEDSRNLKYKKNK